MATPRPSMAAMRGAGPAPSPTPPAPSPPATPGTPPAAGAGGGVKEQIRQHYSQVLDLWPQDPNGATQETGIFIKALKDRLSGGQGAQSPAAPTGSAPPPQPTGPPAPAAPTMAATRMAAA